MHAIWKIKRELNRLAHKPRNLLDLLAGPSMQKYMDRAAGSIVQRGKAGRFPDIALLLLYAPEGVPEDYDRMLDYLESQEVARVVIAHSPLTDEDRARLLAKSHLLIERPNFGYDFGGYRAGVMTLLDLGYDLCNLFIMNDSIWFPLHSDCDLIEAARKDQSDLYGIYMNHRPKSPHRSHLQSYFYRFGPRITKHDDLELFWRSLITYNNKDLTVRRNEMKLTHWFQERGYCIGYRYDISDLQNALLNLNLAQRNAVAAYQIMIGDKHGDYVQRQLACDAYENYDKYKADVKAGILGRYFMITHPTVLIDHLRCPVLKRDKRYPYQVQRAVLLSECYSQELPETLIADIAGRTDIEGLKRKAAQIAFAPT